MNSTNHVTLQVLSTVVAKVEAEEYTDVGNLPATPDNERCWKAEEEGRGRMRIASIYGLSTSPCASLHGRMVMLHSLMVMGLQVALFGSTANPRIILTRALSDQI